jgi:hypothetical protein
MGDVFGGGGGGGGGNNNKAAGAGGRTMPTPQPGAGANNNNPADASARQAPPPPAARRATKAEPPGDSWTGSGALAGDIDQTDPTPASQEAARGAAQRPLPAAEDVQQQPPKKKRRWFGLKVLLPFALLLMAAAAGGIYAFMPVKSSVTGTMTFANFPKLPKHNRVEFVKPQAALLTDDSRALREAAKRRLAEMNKSHSSGFLGDALEYAKLTSAHQFDVDAGTLTLRYVGGAGRADQDRMLALLQAIHEMNRPLSDEATELTRTVEALTRERAELERSMADLKARIDELGTAAERKPDVAERTKLETEAAQLKQTLDTADRRVRDLKLELQGLQNNPPAPAAPAPAAPVAAAAPSPESDAVLQQLHGEMQKLNEQLASIQQGRGMTAQAARQKLDMAVEAFNQHLQQAQPQVQGNAALLAYVTAAQETIKQAREVTDQLIARQQAQFAELAKVKQQLNEKLLERRAEVLKRDPQLVKLMDQRDFKTRQLNAAVEQGLTREAADLKVELSELQTQVAARQTIVPNDGFNADAIDQLQRLADSTQKNLEADRAGVLQQLEQMQKEIAQRQPANANLTPPQQTVTAELNKRIAEVGAAGRQYATSADAANKSADDEVRMLQASASTLVGQIESRKQELAQLAAAAAPPAPAAPGAAPQPAVDPQVAVAQKQQELAAAEQTRAQAEAAYFAANKKLHDLKERLDQARAAGEKRDTLARQRDLAQKNLDQLVNQYELKKKLAEQKAFPVLPTAANVSVDDKGDPRPMYILIACGAIAALTVCLGLISSSGGGGSREDDYAAIPLYPGEAYETDARAAEVYEEQQQQRERPTPVEV